jgi:methionyl aminopeptidase
MSILDAIFLFVEELYFDIFVLELLITSTVIRCSFVFQMFSIHPNHSVKTLPDSHLAMTSGGGACASPGCTNVVEQRLACPKCIQLGMTPTYFCSQSCFKSNYATHKSLHSLAKQILSAQTTTTTASHRKTPPSDGVSCPIDAPTEVKLQLPNWAHNYSFTGNLRPALYSSPRTLPSHIRKPDYALHPLGVSESEQRDRANNTSLRIYGTEELDGEYGLRHACAMGREVLDEAGRALRPGVTTDEIDRVVHEACIERDCYPSPLNYYQFPKSVCTSVNEVICHGIPDYREVQDGDIVNIDVSVYNRNGYHGDLNDTFCVGNVDADGRRLVRTAFDCLAGALNMVRPGTLYRDLGNTIQKIAASNQCSVVRTYCGHGIGSLFHTAPNVPHYAKNKAKGTMQVGHVFTVEPMINLGTYADKTWGDNWTAVTTDGKRSAQFERT